jgi:hypothetical protein
MRYLLDSNSFIQPKNTSYPFDVVPSYWDWLVESNKRGVVFSIEKVEAELLAQQDDLSRWVKARGAAFFLKPDSGIHPELKAVAEWVENHTPYTEAAKQAFFGSADYYLIAQARAEGFIVVTFEKHENSVHRVKIPSVCDGVGVKCCNLYKMLKDEGARF